MLQRQVLHCKAAILRALPMTELAGDIEQLWKRRGIFLLDPSHAACCRAAGRHG